MKYRGGESFKRPCRVPKSMVIVMGAVDTTNNVVSLCGIASNDETLVSLRKNDLFSFHRRH